MTASLIEQVAQATFEQRYGPNMWERMSGGTKQKEMHGAEVALKACLQPTDKMWSGLARDIIMWNRFPSPTGAALHEHLRMLGKEIPQWLKDEIQNVDHVPPKGTVAVCVFKAMIYAELGG